MAAAEGEAAAGTADGAVAGEAAGAVVAAGALVAAGLAVGEAGGAAGAHPLAASTMAPPIQGSAPVFKTRCIADLSILPEKD
jgi:hypothetical protein